MQYSPILNIFEKELNPMKELLEHNSLNNLIVINSKNKFPKDFGIRKKYDYNEIKKNDKDKDKKIMNILYIINLNLFHLMVEII